MAFTYDLGTLSGKVRLLCVDTRDEGHLLEDAEVDAFLELNGDNVRRAAADALETIASNESLVQKAIQLLDIKTNGPAVAADLRKHAASLRAQANAEETDAADPGFDLAEFPSGFWAEREYLWNQESVANA